MLLYSIWYNKLILTIIIFFIGLLGIIYTYKNFLITMFSIELMYLGLTLSFIVIGFDLGEIKAEIISIIYLVIAAAESAIGLGILIILFRFGKSINHEDYQVLKG